MLRSLWLNSLKNRWDCVLSETLQKRKKLDLTKGKPAKLEIEYYAWDEVDLSDLEIEWEDVVDIRIKYTELLIVMKDGTTHGKELHIEPQIDYKVPHAIKVLDEDYRTLGEM